MPKPLTNPTPPETIADLMPQSPDLRAERLAALRKLFPDLFDGEGRLVEEELRKLADPDRPAVGERYEFPWTGKTRSKREAFTPSRAALVYDPDRSVHPTHGGGGRECHHRGREPGSPQAAERRLPRAGQAHLH